MKRILLSVGAIVFVAAVVIGATGAFFSDTETSTGNTFTAGAIDLTIDNTSYLNGAFNSGTSWLQAVDLTNELFFNFSDLKPGDYGEDTISIHVNNNDAYACVDVRLDSNDDNGITEPESAVDSTDGAGNGELADHVDFMWWVDDGDNVLEVGENLLPAGPLGNLSVGEVATIALAEPSGGGVFGGALPGDTTVFLAKAWCFGDISASPVPQDGETDIMSPAGDNEGTGNVGNGTAGQPSDGGFTCSGASSANNITQSDSFEATISFFAEQARNNDSFKCSAHLKSGGV